MTVLYCAAGLPVKYCKFLQQFLFFTVRVCFRVHDINFFFFFFTVLYCAAIKFFTVRDALPNYRL